MSRFSLSGRTAAAAAVLSLAAAGARGEGHTAPRYDDAPASGRVLFVTTDQNQLIRFNSSRPDRIKDIRAITGLAAGATLTGIDFRPATGDLYGVGSDSVVYRVSPRTGIAVAEAPAFTPPLNGRFFGVDFNPTVDKIRVTSDAGAEPAPQRRRGHAAEQRRALNPGMPRVVDSAYTNSSFSAAQADGDDALRDRLGGRHDLAPEPAEQRHADEPAAAAASTSATSPASTSPARTTSATSPPA